MNCKRILACALALVLALSVMCVPAAATFSDVTGSWSWAADYIQDMTQRGIFNGYEDNTFRPANELTAAEALALSARCIGLTDAVTESIAADRADEITAILGTSMSWFHDDFAVCLELGVLTSAELQSMWKAGTLTQSINKETFAVYLVRAMGLNKLAESLQSYSMTFADVSSITAAYRPYVYILNAYGIVEGTTDNKFEPKSSLNRAVSATMLSRIVDFMEDKSLTVELAEYTDYDWAAGTIASAVAGDSDTVLLTLAGEDGTNIYTLSSSTPIYLNNMLVSSTSLKVDMYARVCLNDGDPIAVRLVSADRLASVSGTISGLTDDSITMVVGGVTKTYAIDRFTQVTVGGQTGGRALIDDTEGYTDAVCTADGSDVLMMQLSGGTTKMTGLIRAVTVGTSSTSLQVTSFNGVTRTYTVPSTASIKINSLTGTLKTSHVGYYISMRVSNDESGQVVSATVDTQTDYIQATVLGITYTSIPNTIYAKNLSSGESIVYTMADDPTITYEGTAVLFTKVAKGWYFTAKLDSNGYIEVLEACAGSVTVDGTLASISYGTTTVLTVTSEEGDIYAFSLDMADLPEILRSDATSSIDKLRAGDTVSVTSQYNEVTLIESEPQKANVTGTIVRIIQEVSGSTLELELDDGSTASYTVTTATTITKNGVAMTLTSLQPGYSLALLVSEGRVTSIEVESTETETSNTELTGTILYVNTTDKTILLRMTDSNGTEYTVTVNTSYKTTYLSVEGSSLAITKLAIGDEVTAYGAYDGGEFDANVIIRRSES